jgi:hypothetical protein
MVLDGVDNAEMGSGMGDHLWTTLVKLRWSPSYIDLSILTKKSNNRRSLHHPFFLSRSPQAKHWSGTRLLETHSARGAFVHHNITSKRELR